jgi:hypothetical protein
VEVREPRQQFTFRSPVEGTLDYLLMYMLDRTERTAPDVFTPMDVYRQGILGEPGGKSGAGAKQP